MKTAGFPISRKENEYRRAIVPVHLKNIEHPELLYFEKGYGEVFGLKILNTNDNWETSLNQACDKHLRKEWEEVIQ